MSQSEKYSFNTRKFKEFVDGKKTTPTTVAKAIGKTNGGIAQRWYDGSDISAEHICKLANKYGLHPLMFFKEGGESMFTTYHKYGSEVKSSTERISSPDESTKRTHKENEILQLKLEHQKALHAKEVECLNRIADMQKAIRKEVKAEMMEERDRIEQRYEEKLERKDQRISELMTQVSELQAQFRELELSAQRQGGFGYPRGMADSETAYKSK